MVVSTCIVASVAVGLIPLGAARADRPRMLVLESLGELQRGRPAAAVSLLEEARRLAPHDATVFVNLGAAYQRSGRLADAVGAFRSARSMAASSAILDLNLGRSFYQLNRPDSAAFYLQAAADGGAGVDALRLLAATERARKRPDRAEAALRRLLALVPDDVTAREDLGVLLLQAGRLQDAVRELERVVAAGPVQPDPYMNLGIAYAQLGRSRETLHAFERAHVVAPRDRAVVLTLAAARAQLGDREGAAQLLRDYLRDVGSEPTVESALRGITGGAR
jgi:Flp pilus assembly protein TadD